MTNMNAEFTAVVLLLENMSLTPEQAARVNSAIHVIGTPISSDTSIPASVPVGVNTPDVVAPASSESVSVDASLNALLDASLDIVDPVDGDDDSQEGATDTVGSPLDLTPVASVDQTSDAADAPAGPAGGAAQAPVVVPQGLAAATTLHHLPVHTIVAGEETRFQHAYRGISFDIPRGGSTGPFYLVTRGLRVGVFSTWSHTAPHVIGISCASFRRVQCLNDGLLAMLEAIGVGVVQILP